MIEQRYLDMYFEIVGHFELAKNTLKDLINAICLADYLYGDNDKKLDYDRFLLSIDITNEEVFNNEKALPDVQILRVLCDSLIIGVQDAADFTLTMPKSTRVAKAEEVERTGRDDYLDEAGCISLLEELHGLVEQAEEQRSDIENEFLQYASTQINSTVTKIMNTYQDLFSSGYQVIKPVGLLTQRGIMKVRDGHSSYEDSYEATELYNYLCGRLNIVENNSRQFDCNSIVDYFTQNESKRLYFPNKLLEYTYGCGQGSENNYSTSSASKSWESYASEVVEPQIDEMCKDVLVTLFRISGYLEDDSYKEHFDLLTGMLDYLYANVTPCLIVSNWKKVQRNIVGFKLRVSDTDKKLPLTQEIPQYIINNCFRGLVGADDAVCEAIVPVGHEDYTVVDIQHKFDPKLINGEPLFAYTALNALQNSGKSPSWNELLLGKKDDDSILTVGSEISFRKHLCHWILAGSRSGKGVMTLNILAGAIASGKPVFYLDNKPDMASMFRSAELSGGKMFCINGDYDPSFDVRFNSCSPSSFRWNRNIPDYIQAEFGTNYADYAPIFYLRAVLFLMSLIYVRGNVRTNPELFNMLGGESGVVIVIDEITAADAGINALLSKGGRLGSLFYSSSTLSKARKKIREDKRDEMDITQFGCYSTDFIQSLNSTFRTICRQWKHKGLSGGGTEGDISNIFVIGQAIHSVDTSKEEYMPTNDNNMNGMCGDAFYNALFDLGNDVFMGYNIDHPEYMMSGDRTSKSYTRLNATARNFAYLSNFDTGVVDTMLNDSDGGKSSKGLSEKAKYFKPFLIFNDAAEDSQYVNGDFRKMCGDAGLNFEQVKNMHRNEQGAFEPKIGFIPYINAQSSNGASVQDTLAKSYNIANALVQAYIPNYDGDCIDFIYDLRPEAMFTAQELLNAFTSGQHQNVSPLVNEFFGQGAVRNQYQGVDFNAPRGSADTATPAERPAQQPERPVQQPERNAQPSARPQTENRNNGRTNMYDGFNTSNYQFRGRVRWNNALRRAAAEFIAKDVMTKLGSRNNDLYNCLVEKAQSELMERGY